MDVPVEKINVAQKFNSFNQYWSPKIVAALNDSYVKVAKFKGEFIWHKHEYEDELFFISKGKLLIKMRDQPNITLNEGEFVVIPRGVEHMPVAQDEVHVMLIEPKTTVNTGNVTDSRTVRDEWV